jgi:hypothetical protein
MDISSSDIPGNRGNFKHWEWIFAALVGIAVFAAFTVWGGIPSDDRVGVFWLLVAVLLVVSAGFGLVTWHLLFRPLPAGHKAPTVVALPASMRLGLSVLLAVGGLCLVIGPFWDEIWHRTYGIPFGEDFFWRPHLLLYFGFGAGVLVGFWGLWYVMRSYKGTFQQRLRTNPLLGLLILSSAFLMYVVPADPIWHIVYGRDLSAWSIPHILLLISIGFIMLMSAALYLSTQPRRDWQGVHKITLSDVLPILMFAGIIMPWLQILTIDWDTAIREPDALLSRFRPEWLMAANIVFSATFAGVIANRSLRYVGAATLTGVVALALRVVMIQIFQVQELMYFTTWILALAPLVAIDLWTAYQVRTGSRSLSWIGTGVAAAVGMVIAAPLLTTFYPMLTLTNIIGFAVAALVSSLGASWLGMYIGEYIANQNRDMVEVDETSRRVNQPLVSMGTLAAFLVFVVFFIVTASPPV